jgi:hypothetical protein
MPPVPPREIVVAWHSGRRPSPLLDAFVTAAADVCDQIAERWSQELAA